MSENICAECGIDLSARLDHAVFCSKFENLEDEGLPPWESFKFESDEAERFFEAVDRGDLAEVERIVDGVYQRIAAKLDLEFEEIG